MNSLLQNESNDIEVQEGFKIDSLESANWAFRKIRALKEDIKEKEELAIKERERIDNWLKSETESVRSSISFFEGLLTEYYLLIKKDNPKAKISTPYGKVSSRKSKTWNYEDEDLTIKYLKENKHSNLIRVQENLNKSELKKVFKDGVNEETGEIIPGLNVVQVENISIKVE